jgi:hypothetical protein
MTAAVELQESRIAWEQPQTKPQNEAVWQAWVAKGREQERRSSAMHVEAAKWVSLVGLIVAASVWSHLAGYDVAVRFVVTGGSLIAMSQAFRMRHYAFGAVFGALVVLFNPVAPILGFSSDWQRAAVVASAFPFVAALAWPRESTVGHD